MYGPKWPFLLMYGSHDMRHSGIPQVDRSSTDPREMGHSQLGIKAKVNDYLGSSVGVSVSMVLIPASQLGIRA